ncbi:MAG: potassium-transporting ATPase subunit KdpC [Elusimicrobia bacterium]|nr:potassium-transporting ATPase subunit KdpC [Elusimicrobiota bacterium]
MGTVLSQFRPAAMSLLVLSALTGVVYPAAVTAAAQLLFPWRANGSLVERGGRAVGSELIGQAFSDPGRFWGRPSATGPSPYNAAASSGSNLGPTNPALLDAVRARVEALRGADPGNARPAPVDLVTASASGLDPHISPAAATYQVPRVARALGRSEAEVRTLLERRVEGRLLGLLGEPRVNVLLLNLDLEGLRQKAGPHGRPMEEVLLSK